MAYITKSNSKRILKKIDINEIPYLEGEVFRRKIFFLSSWEKKYLLLMQYLFKEPEKFAVEVYKPVINIDSFQYVYESEQSPSYHTNIDCPKLKSKFTNFEIPFEIKARVRERGGDEELEKKEVIKFRDWFKKNTELFQKDPEQFLHKLDVDWNIQRNLKEIEKDNSGVENFENYDLAKLDVEIDKIITESMRYFTSNPDKQSAIRRFQQLTFLAYKKDKIQNNNTLLNDQELKEFLIDYDARFKKPIKNLLVEYYRVKYNKDLSFEGKILDRLNFRECSVCNGTAALNFIIDDTPLNENPIIETGFNESRPDIDLNNDPFLRSQWDLD